MERAPFVPLDATARSKLEVQKGRAAPAGHQCKADAKNRGAN